MLKIFTSSILSIIIAVSLSACTSKTSNKTENRKDKVSTFILQQVPAGLTKKVGADLDGKIELIGYSLKEPTVVPGGKIKITWYWKCNKTPGTGWRIFTHMLDGTGKSKINRDKQGPIRKHFQPEHWATGMIIEDPQTIAVPKSWNSPVVDLRLGLWRSGERMHVDKLHRDKENRIKGARISVILENKETALIPYASEKPVIDGVFKEEPAWNNALTLDKFYHTLNGTEAALSTIVKVMWDTNNLYVAMTAEDNYLQSKYTEHDDELWHEDAFEIFIDPKGDKRHYYELQINPKGIMFDSYLPSYRKNTNEWSSETKAAVQIDGTMNDSKDGDKGWTAELSIPFASMENGGGIPPKEGDNWKINFFRVDATSLKPIYSAWSPPLRGDFHALDKFGSIKFGPSPISVTQEKSTVDSNDSGAK